MNVHVARPAFDNSILTPPTKSQSIINATFWFQSCQRRDWRFYAALNIPHSYHSTKIWEHSPKTGTQNNRLKESPYVDAACAKEISQRYFKSIGFVESTGMAMSNMILSSMTFGMAIGFVCLLHTVQKCMYETIMGMKNVIIAVLPSNQICIIHAQREHKPLQPSFPLFQCRNPEFR